MIEIYNYLISVQKIIPEHIKQINMDNYSKSGYSGIKHQPLFITQTLILPILHKLKAWNITSIFQNITYDDKSLL